MKSVIKCLRLSLLAVMMVCTAAIHASNDPLCFTARNGSVTVSFEIKNVTPSTIQYSTDSTTWNTCSDTTTVALSANGKVYFRAATDQTSASAVAFGSEYSSNNYSHFTFSGAGTVDASGNIMSLYGPNCPDITLPSYAFAFMFDECSTLTTAPALPATTLDSYCYQYMFDGCTALTSAPALPATTLANGCYESMFEYCSALTSAPALPATTLANGCYYGMFWNCSALTSVPALPATTLADYCYKYMFWNCSALTSAPALPATTLADECYESMFYGCTALTSAPALPATTLANGCYEGMFSGCTSLTSAPELPATTLANDCYDGMFSECSSLTSAPALPATTLAYGCYSSMFSGCTALTSAPALPATTLAEVCYYNMFSGCTALTSAPALPATTLAYACYSYMFWNCSALTSAPALPATTLADHCYYNMFRNCSALTSAPELPATTLANDCYREMFRNCSSLKVNIAPPGKNWSINATSIGTGALTDMFSGTGGTMNGTPSANTTYYIYIKDSICYDTICLGESFTNYGFNIDASDIHSGDNTFTRTKTATSDDDLDTLITLYLNVPETHHEIYETICNGAVYNFAGLNITASGNYQDIASTPYGCLDTTILHLTVNERYDNYENATICQGETYNWGGNTYSAAGDYTDSLRSKDGCDSVMHLHLTVTEPTHDTINETICKGESFLWHGLSYSQAGNYIWMGSDSNGCELYEHLNLSVINSDSTMNVSICNGGNFVFMDTVITTDGTWTRSKFDANIGCNITITLNLTVDSAISTDAYDYVCEGYLYSGYGISNFPVNKDTVVTVYAKTKTYCDSISRIHIQYVPSHHSYEDATICHGENYTWYHQTYTTAGDYTLTLSSTDGCDSIAHLHLAVVDKYDHYENAIICSGASYTWNGNQYSKPGDYTVTLSSEDGCDSVVHLHLIVIDNTGVDNAEMSGVSVYSENSKIVVNGAEGRELRVYDAVGRLLAIKESADEMESVEVPSAGIYFVTLDNGANLRIMVR